MSKNKVSDNGRTSLENLRKQYSKVIIKHSKNTDGSGKTTVLLIEGTNIFVGVAKFSNRGDSFSRVQGRLIAQGRAELAAQVFKGQVSERVNASKQREKLSYTVNTSLEQVQTVVDSYLNVE